MSGNTASLKYRVFKNSQPVIQLTALSVIHDKSAAAVTDEIFVGVYNRLLKKEGRIYPDEVLFALPEISTSDPQYAEWMINRYAYRKLVQHLKQKKCRLKILDVGCGNGWLPAQLARNIKCDVQAMDINRAALKQARKVFAGLPNLRFYTGNMNGKLPAGQVFDVIVFSGSIRFLSSLESTITEALNHLTLKGEIHIINAKFYQEEMIAAERQSLNDYLTRMGAEAISSRYFFYTLKSLEAFNCKILFDPQSMINKLFGAKNPFHHIMIKKYFL